MTTARRSPTSFSSSPSPASPTSPTSSASPPPAAAGAAWCPPKPRSSATHPGGRPAGSSPPSPSASCTARTTPRRASSPWLPRRAASGLLRQPPGSLTLSTLVDGALFDGCSEIVASRNGLLVVDLRRGKHDRALKLCVCNPLAGEVHVLPSLGAKESPGHYACTVLTADDSDENPPRSSSYLRLVMVYARRGLTAFRSYSSEEGSWSEEAKVSSARLGQKHMGLTHGGIVHHGGRLVYWLGLAKNTVFVLSLEKLQSVVVSVPRSGQGQKFDMENTLLGLSPEGRLCAVQFGHLFLTAANRRVSVRVTTRTDHGWDKEELIQIEQSLPADVISVRLRWFGEKSGVVFFSAVAGDSDHRRSEMYALSLSTRVVGDPWGHVHGYEMDQAAYLASLAEREGMEDM
ncbi:uncharacterized protein LOC120711463 isoform X2 [Panicum virgatum]|uniref:uncharacterized protein LOC120711463 isoform X2 n=1 Tax=Panicum virgatum TaxID=38727 RepID=UPI0019D5C7C7|nr:uncharacterized protein LOC120711463 isoform X2 [Panicum virgatum]